MSAPAWQLAERPSWYLGDLRGGQRPRIERVPMIYRAVVPSSALIERTAEGDAPILTMRFALFGRWQEINNPEGHFMERVAPGAFRKTIRENLANIRAVLSHGKDPSLGNTVLGTIESIEEAPDSASARVSLFRSVPALLLDGLKAGVYGASFRGAPIKSHFEYRPGRSEHNPERLPEVTRQEIRLHDVGPTPFAQYPGTSATIGGFTDSGLTERSLPDQRPYWELRNDEEPYWNLQRKEQHGLTTP
jgi:phage head maturation protease